MLVKANADVNIPHNVRFRQKDSLTIFNGFFFLDAHIFFLRSQDGTTPLNKAAQRGHFEIVKLLLEAKACPLTPDSVVCSHHFVPIFLQPLLDTGQGGFSPIFSASFLGHHEIIPLLAEAGGDVNAVLFFRRFSV